MPPPVVASDEPDPDPVLPVVELRETVRCPVLGCSGATWSASTNGALYEAGSYAGPCRPDGTAGVWNHEQVSKTPGGVFWPSYCEQLTKAGSVITEVPGFVDTRLPL